MNSFQRAWRSMFRKPVKSSLLLLVIVAVSLSLLCGMACQNASIQTQDTTRQAVGAGLRLDGNESNRTKRLEETTDKITHQPGYLDEGELDGVYIRKLETAYGTQWYVGADNSFDSLLMDDIEKLAAVPGISDYNVTTKITPVNPVNFTRIEDPDNDQYNDIGGVTLLGNRKMELDFNVLSGNVTVKEGRMIGMEDRDVCVISEQLAQRNSLHIGDTLQFNDCHDPESAPIWEAVIIGIYQTQQFMQPLMSGDTYRSENVVFTDLRFPEKAENETEPCFEHAYFRVGDVDEYDAVKLAVEAADIDWERYDLIDRNGNLATMSSNFHDLEKISKVLIALTFAAGFVILFLIFLFWTKNRNQEIGILLSLGFRKVSVIGQFLMEALLITLLSFGVTVALAPVASEAVADYLIAAQVEQAEIQRDWDAGKVMFASQQTEQTVMGVDVKITEEMWLLSGAGVIVLIVVSIGIAGIPVLRKKPREILSELS